MGSAIRLLARTEVRNRWRTLVVLGIIGGLVAGLVLAAIAGARRTSTAYDRYRDAVAAPDAMFAATQVGIDADYTAVRALPEIVDSGMFVGSPVALKGIKAGTLPPGDDRLYRTIARPLLVEGRLPEPKRSDEIVVNRQAAKRLGLRVGQRVTIVTSTEAEALFTEDEAAQPSGGPSIPARVVGIGDTPLDLTFFGEEPGFIPSGALLAQHPEIPRVGNLLVRLRPGTDIKAFHDRANQALKETNREKLEEAAGVDADVPVRDFAEDRKRFVHGTDLERTALLLFAAAAALAALVMVGQALTRTVYAMADEVAPLRALGFTPRDLVTGMVAPLALTALVAGAVTVATAIALSVHFPVGLAGRFDPDRGIHADWLILAPGAAAIVLLVLGGSAVAAGRAASARSGGSVPPDAALLRGIRRVAPLPMALGAGLALDPGRGPRAVPVRPAIAGAVAGVLGVVGSLGLVHGIDDALAEPSRSGQAWDAVLSVDREGTPVAEVVARVVANPKVESAAEVFRAPIDVQGAGVPAYSLEAARGAMSFVVLGGRAPAAPDEVAVAPSTRKAIGADVGDRVRIGPHDAEVEIVGTALLPQTAHSSFDQGVWMTRPGLERVLDSDLLSSGEPQVFVRAKPGVGLTALTADFKELVPLIEPASLPQDVELLENVRTLPRALAVFLALLGIAAVGHALVTTVRRRAHDFAVMRTLGLRPGQTRAAVAWQATTVGVIALLVGIPLGVAAGRITWRWVADSTPLLYVAPLAVAAVLLAIPAALLIANALAAVPARRAGRIRPAVVLRTE